jgi:tRNA-specific 2-thiouridylase
MAGPLHWLCAAREAPFRAGVRLRHRQPLQPARVVPRQDGGARIEFEQPQRAVAPGQYAVLYEQQRCLGGGVILEARDRVPGEAHIEDAARPI